MSEGVLTWLWQVSSENLSLATQRTSMLMLDSYGNRPMCNTIVFVGAAAQN